MFTSTIPNNNFFLSFFPVFTLTKFTSKGKRDEVKQMAKGSRPPTKGLHLITITFVVNSYNRGKNFRFIFNFFICISHGADL